MNINEDKLLAVSTCTKRMGVAVFNSSELIYFAVVTFKSPRTAENIDAQVSKTLRTITGNFIPQSAVIKTLTNYQIKSGNQMLIAAKVKKEAAKAGIPLKEISFETVKRELCSEGRPTKINAFKSLSAIYPELKLFVNHPSKWQASYYDSLLSAAAVGYYCSQNKIVKKKPLKTKREFKNRLSFDFNNAFLLCPKTLLKTKKK